MMYPAPEPAAFAFRYRATVLEARHQAYLTAGQGTKPWLRFGLRMLSPIIIAALGLFVVDAGDSSSRATYVEVLAAFIVLWCVAAFYLLYQPWRPSAAARRWYADEQTTSFYADLITTVSAVRSVSVRWEGITEIRQDLHAIVFMRRGVILFWLPGSAFGSVGQREQFLDYARAQMAAHPALIEDSGLSGSSVPRTPTA